MVGGPDEAGAKRAKFQHAHAELAEAKARSERLRALETDAETVVTPYSKVVPQFLDTITPEERNRLYRTLRLGVEVRPDGKLEVGAT